MPKKRGRYRVKRQEVTQPLDQSYRLIPLTQNKVTKVDAGDFEWLSKFNWSAHRDCKTGRFYAFRYDGTRYLAIHAAIMGGQKNQSWDHKNTDSLDNRRRNLRKCTNAQNARNRGAAKTKKNKLKGAIWHKRIGKWQSAIRVNRKPIHLGYFSSAKEAARAYDKAAIELHGAFANLNFPITK